MTAATESGTDVEPEVRLLGDRFRSGQESALAEAFERWSPLIHTIARRALATEAHADDITQQVFVKAWRSHARFDPDIRPLPAWLVGITRHVLADHAAAQARDRQLVVRLATDFTVEDVPPADAVVDTVVISQGLARVDQPRREILGLVLFAGLTQAQVAGRLDLPLGTVKSHVRRGLIQLRAMMEVTDEAP